MRNMQNVLTEQTIAAPALRPGPLQVASRMTILSERKASKMSSGAGILADNLLKPEPLSLKRK